MYVYELELFCFCFVKLRNRVVRMCTLASVRCSYSLYLFTSTVNCIPTGSYLEEQTIVSYSFVLHCLGLLASYVVISVL